MGDVDEAVGKGQVGERAPEDDGVVAGHVGELKGARQEGH